MYVVVRENGAVLHLEFPYVEIVGRDSVDGRRIVVVSVHQLSAGVHRRRYGSHAVEFSKCLIVLYLEGLHVVGALAHTSALHIAGVYHNHIRPHLGNLRLDAVLGALADGKHSDDRCHAYDYAEHCEEAAELVVVQRLERYLE